jgi:hypothetical protein
LISEFLEGLEELAGKVLPAIMQALWLVAILLFRGCYRLYVGLKNPKPGEFLGKPISMIGYGLLPYMLLVIVLPLSYDQKWCFSWNPYKWNTWFGITKKEPNAWFWLAVAIMVVGACSAVLGECLQFASRRYADELKRTQSNDKAKPMSEETGGSSNRRRP